MVQSATQSDKRTKVIKCLHCRNRSGTRARGLCSQCFLTPTIRKLYPLLERPRDTTARVTGANEPEPTDAEPGSPAKLEVLIRRVENNERLWHEDDNGMEERRDLSRRAERPEVYRIRGQ